MAGCPTGNVVVRCTTVHCPKCGGHIDYNGNFFCTYWGNELDSDCNWALPHPTTKEQDKNIAIQLWKAGYTNEPDFR